MFVEEAEAMEDNNENDNRPLEKSQERVPGAKRRRRATSSGRGKHTGLGSPNIGR
jgi:hypothetical protein